MNTDLPKIDRIEHWSDSDKADRTPEQRIYKAVLSRSLMDAIGYTLEPNPAAHLLIMERAQMFFAEPSPSFMRICQGADVDARELREQALKVIKQYNINGERPAAITQGRRGRKRKAA